MHWVSFYSYKGGVGRSTALVNSAVHLAIEGRTIVLVDFDTEAPGLHYWYKGITGKPFRYRKRSLYDLFLDVGTELYKARANFKTTTTGHLDWAADSFFNVTTFDNYVSNFIDRSLVRVPLPKKIDNREVKGNIFLLPCRAGSSEDPQFVIDWHELFGRSPTPIRIDARTPDPEILSAEGPGYLLLRSLRRALSNSVLKNVHKIQGKSPGPLYVLADMRTGWTFSSFLLTLSLSDALVCITSRHKQSVDGIVRVLCRQQVKASNIIPVISPMVAETFNRHQDKQTIEIDRLDTIKARLNNAASLQIDSQKAPQNKIHGEIIEVPFDVRLALSEAIIVTSDEDSGAPSSYRRLATRIKETHPSELKPQVSRIHDATKGFIDDQVEIRSRDSHFEKVLDRVKFRPYWEKRVVLFGGISSHLSSEEAIAAYAQWLCLVPQAELFICYESLSSALTRAVTLDPSGVNNADTRKRMQDKYHEWTKLADMILLEVPQSEKISVSDRVFLIELTLPITQYVIIGDSNVYLAPVTEKRSTKSCSILIRSGTNPLRAQTLDFVHYHLQHVSEHTKLAAVTLERALQEECNNPHHGKGELS